MFQDLLFGLLLGSCLLMASCSAEPKTNAENFHEDQLSTITPHGKIDPGSISETTDGKINYKTTDGKNWRTTISKNADGTRRYEQPINIPK